MAAADAGRPLPDDTPWWAPPASFDARTSEALAALCLLTLICSYGGGTLGLLTQTLPYAADAYSVDDRTLAVGLAVVRVGVVLALVLGPLADRLGRRRLVIHLTLAHCVVAGVAGLAPDYEAYTAAHVVLRCLDTALGIAIAVLVAELAPAGSRALSLSLVALSAGGGIVLARKELGGIRGTRIRSAAQTLTLVIGVSGSALGLGVVAALSGSLELGPSIACLTVLPVISAFIFAFAFGETARRELEDTSLEGRPA